MILLHTASDDDDIKERRRSSYVTRKEWRVVLFAAIVFGAILFTIYKFAEKESQFHICTGNFQQMRNAIFVYAANNNDRLPPVFAEDGKGEPLLIPSSSPAGDAPYSWVSLIQPAMEVRASFVCPSADGSERSSNLHPTDPKSDLFSTYGMYRARSAWPLTMIRDPDSTVIITETSNRGSANTFDPMPFKSAPDGIAIGWNDSNLALTKDSAFVTRLAFPKSEGGKFAENGLARHSRGINVLFASGRRGLLKPPDAKIERLGNEPTGYWSDR